jgi:hypothetical protein
MKMMSGNFRIGDRVKWESGRAIAEGKVVEVATQSGQIGDFVYDASRERPRYIVKTTDGRLAAQRADALRHI